MIRLFLSSALLILLLFCSVKAEDRPNIIWIFAEDTSPWMGCYGHDANQNATPNIDSIADEGIIFNRAYVPAPVCSACRSAMMLGGNQIRFGVHEHRSSRDKDAQIQLPEGIKLLPQIMMAEGYSTFNFGKTDYNFVWPQDETYTKAKIDKKTDKFALLKAKQPFFAQFQTKGGKIGTKGLASEKRTDPATVTIPADYPQNDLYREVVAQHCDAIRTEDEHIGEILKQLKDSGMEDNTIVVYLSDHGANHLVRHKQMPTEGGLHVPLMMKGPEKYIPQKGARNDLVNTLDLTATTLAWAGIAIPDWYEGNDLFAKDFKARKWVASAKDRLDHTIDRVRTIRTEKFRYTRNYKLDRILLQPQYRDGQNYLKNLKELYAAGELSADLKRIYFGERAPEEFYDVVSDPAQVHNLINDPNYTEEIARHRKLLDEWLAKGDRGEGEEVAAALIRNGDTWKGGRGVNPEYEANRVDSDGDGLSDKWEKINGRDPKDGKLYYEFDCGGWQTEGWTAKGISDNIAGFQGYLDFRLGEKAGRLIRKDLKVTNDSNKNVVIKMRSSSDIKVASFINGSPMGSAKATAGNDFAEVKIPLARNATGGTIESLEISLEGSPQTEIEIDSIKVE